MISIMFILAANCGCHVDQFAQHGGGKTAGSQAKTQYRRAAVDPGEFEIAHGHSQRTTRCLEPIALQASHDLRKTSDHLGLERGDVASHAALAPAVKRARRVDIECGKPRRDRLIERLHHETRIAAIEIGALAELQPTPVRARCCARRAPH